MRFVKIILIGLGSILGIILFFFFIGVPTVNEKFLEQRTHNSTFIAFSDSSMKCVIWLIPEVLDRLIVDIKFDNINGSKEFLKTMDLKIISDNQEQERIFDIYIKKYNPSTLTYDQTIIKNFNELTSDLKHMDFPFTITPQFKLDKKDKFDLGITLRLKDPVTKKERLLNNTFKIRNDKKLKLERFRTH